MRFPGQHRTDTGTGYSRSLWPVLVLLLVAVLTPTVCALWFMIQAMNTARLAGRQRLENAYAGQLETVRQAIGDYWRQKASALSDIDFQTAPSESFARLVRAKVADSVVLFDDQGNPLYPNLDRFVAKGQEESNPTWQSAVHVELAANDPARAAELFAAIAREAQDVDLIARALRAQARCLAKSSQPAASLEILLKTLSDARFQEARDVQGRLIVPNAQLFALSLLPPGREWGETAGRLVMRLNDYGPPEMPAPQRRFLMAELGGGVRTDAGTLDRQLSDLKEFGGLTPDQLALTTIDAENLAGEFLEKGAHRTEPGLLGRSPMEGVWQGFSADRRAALLFRQGTLVEQMERIAATAGGLSDATLVVRPAAEVPGVPLLTSPVGAPVSVWRLAVYLAGPDPFSAAAEKRIAVYGWTAVLVIATAAALAVLLALYLGRQVRLTRLKNDLIATVSHELKTPLTSIRVLTDTLLAGRAQDETKAREYLALIARENLRLSRLIDSFLTFSRMERNKRKFEMREIPPAQVAAEAVEAVRERYDSAGFRLEVDTRPDLPAVVGDRDALVTVVINLLDNAWKYSQNDRRVMLRTWAQAGEVRFEVADHGIGLSRRDLKRIFEKFYQVDRSLSRETGGCGLGLSIVKFIVEAHNGSVEVTSRPGQGSTFAVRLPAAKPGEV